MNSALFAAWGFFGGFAVEGLEFSRAIRYVRDWPWKGEDEPSALSLGVSVIIRLVVSTGLSVAAGEAHQVAGPFGALAIGASAPLIMEQLARNVPLAGHPQVNAGTPTSPQGVMPILSDDSKIATTESVEPGEESVP